MLPEKSPEFQLIERFRQTVGARLDVPVGIGDDAAVVRRLPETGLLATDLLLEGVHFEIPPATPRQVGCKAMAVNLSDIAAMAGKPRFAVVSLALPQQRHDVAGSLADELFAGLNSTAERFGVTIVGGDTTSWNGPLVINVSIMGDVHPRGPVTRSGARPGDWVFVTGRLGGSLAGHHLTFEPRVEEARRLHESVDLHAMLDVSDGLVADIYHILEESGVGVILNSDHIPISQVASQCDDQRSPLQHALGDGEDFELLFTVSPEDGERLLLHSPVDVELSRIGTITRECRCLLSDPVRGGVELPRIGWVHAIG
jgi:thiamine-monophosphate kinase